MRRKPGLPVACVCDTLGYGQDKLAEGVFTLAAHQSEGDTRLSFLQIEERSEKFKDATLPAKGKLALCENKLC